jgi:hypothetical protein
VFDNRVLMRISGPKRDEATKGWTKLHNDEVHNLCSSPNYNDEVKEDEMGRASSNNFSEEECI